MHLGGRISMGNPDPLGDDVIAEILGTSSCQRTESNHKTNHNFKNAEPQAAEHLLLHFLFGPQREEARQGCTAKLDLGYSAIARR